MVYRTITMISILALLISPLSSLKAEDYPQGYLGSGYREYLSGKIQNGYYVEVFTKIDMRQKEKVNKRNQVEEILEFSYRAGPDSSNEIWGAENLKAESADKINAEIATQRQQRLQVAAAQGEFSYIPYSDGKVVYFTDGLATQVKNERVIDEFGNVSIKNTFNMQYNDKRLLTSYEATLKDNLGNISQLFWYGVSYTPDSVFYGNKDTLANKNISNYYLKEIDSAGNVKLTRWQAVSYEGRLLRAFSQTIEDSIYGNASFTRSNITYEGNNPERPSSYYEEGVGTDGLSYRLDRTNTYNDKDQITGYYEISRITQVDGAVSIVTTDAKLKYLKVGRQFGPDVEEPDPDRLLESLITTTVENADGSFRTETTTTKYNYTLNQQLIDAVGSTEFTGQESDYWEYKDRQGHILGRQEDENGNVIYSYVDPDTLKVVIVNPNEITATLEDGFKYKGSSITQYENLYGRLLTKKVDSKTYYYRSNISEESLREVETSTFNYTNGLINNLQRALYRDEHTETTYAYDPDNSHKRTTDISLKYEYDDKGNLVDLTQVPGTGRGSGWENEPERGWWGEYVSEITREYEVIWGKPVETYSKEDKEYIEKR